MKTKTQLKAMIEAGTPVLLNGHHVGTLAGLDEHYDAAKEAHDAEADRMSGGSTLARMATVVSELRPLLPADSVPKAEHEALKNSIVTDHVPKEVADTLADRNARQADLIDALTKDVDRLKKLDSAAIRAVAAFEGLPEAETREKTLEAILAKRAA